MQNYLIKNISVVNEGTTTIKDVLFKNGRIERIEGNIQTDFQVTELNGEGKYLLPGAIDDQVHFREPGLTHKATIYTESKAAVAGGVTSFMEMPNTIPPVFTHNLLENKYTIAADTSLANYSFYMGTSNDNAEEALKMNEHKKDVCGIKIFMGSSTGGLLVDNYLTLDRIFRDSEVLIATHCEDEKIIKANLEKLKKTKPVPEPSDHPIIRDENACYESSLAAIQFAKKYNTRLHILHISTEKELLLFTNLMPAGEKNITAEVCVHHLHFTSNDYARLGNLIKCNPAIKAPQNREALWKALLDDRLDVIATDHAPHTLTEKGVERNTNGILIPQKDALYEKAHAGLPLVQHPVLLMLKYVQEGRLSLEKMVEKMSHTVAKCYKVVERGFLKEGYWADAVMVNRNANTTVTKDNILYKCGWSPLESDSFPASITHTFVNGRLVYRNEDGISKWDESNKGQRLRFNR